MAVTQIHDWYDLRLIEENMAGDYALANDLDSESDGYSEMGGVFDQIDGTFTGTLDGQHHRISDITIDKAGDWDAGIFYAINGGSVKDLGLINMTIKGIDGGALASYLEDANIQNVAIQAKYEVSGGGGLCYEIYNSTVSNCWLDILVEYAGDMRFGGLSQSLNGANVDNVAVLGDMGISGSVEGNYHQVAGVGYDIYNSTVNYCYFTGTIDVTQGVDGEAYGFAYSIDSDSTNRGCYVSADIYADNLEYSNPYARSGVTSQANMVSDTCLWEYSKDNPWSYRGDYAPGASYSAGDIVIKDGFEHLYEPVFDDWIPLEGYGQTQTQMRDVKVLQTEWGWDIKNLPDYEGLSDWWIRDGESYPKNKVIPVALIMSGGQWEALPVRVFTGGSWSEKDIKVWLMGRWFDLETG